MSLRVSLMVVRSVGSAVFKPLNSRAFSKGPAMVSENRFIQNNPLPPVNPIFPIKIDLILTDPESRQLRDPFLQIKENPYTSYSTFSSLGSLGKMRQWYIMGKLAHSPVITQWVVMICVVSSRHAPKPAEPTPY